MLTIVFPHSADVAVKERSSVVVIQVMEMDAKIVRPLVSVLGNVYSPE